MYECYCNQARWVGDSEYSVALIRYKMGVGIVIGIGIGVGMGIALGIA